MVSGRVHPETIQDSGNMGGFFQQLKALLWRNFILKKRAKAKLVQELLSPIIFLLLLAVLKVGTQLDTLPPRTFSPQDVNSSVFDTGFTRFSYIYGTPNTTQHNKWMQDIVGQLNGPPQYEMFLTEADMEEHYKNNSQIVKFCVVFDYDGDPNAYAIRTEPGTVPSSSSIFNFNQGCREKDSATSSSCEVNEYLTSGFVELQLAIDSTLMSNLKVPKSVISSRQTYVQLMGVGALEPDTSAIQVMSTIFFVLSFCVFANYLVVNIVSEKEKKIKDGMLMMGLNPNVFWLSWSITYLVMVMIAAGLMIIIILVTKFFENSNMFLLFLMIVMYGTSFIAMGFMLTPFFDKARVAGAVASFTTLVVSLLYMAVSETRDQYSYDSNVPAWSQWLMCLLSPIAFATCMDQAIFLDIRRGGFNFDDSLTYGKFPLYAPILMLVVDTVLYALLTIYFDKVIPGEYGVKYKPYFFLQPSYWCPSKVHGESQLLVTNSDRQRAVDIESVPADFDRRLAMKISSISKSFEVDGKTTDAIKDFSLDIYEGQITCLLGHNGAGKTTLMNMLTGVIPPTSGVATIMGLNITNPNDMALIRKKCGICPQQNILFEKLSCKEHLRVFADIKGVPSHLRDQTVLQSLRDVDLENQADTFSKDLSGGQKRKLCVAMALIGDPKLIFLDEPTAGMDPYSRRHLWSLLKQKKEGRVVLLTTHFMDEADILSDRKAFVRKGQLRCCGSSLFLKNKFGVGYHLTLVSEPQCDVSNLTNFFTSVIPEIKYERSHGKEIGYTVPVDNVSSFPSLFRKLDDNAPRLGIRSYGVSMTTLEEVFLKIEDIDQEADEEDGDEGSLIAGQHKSGHNTHRDVQTAIFSKRLVTDKWELTKQQFSALLWLRFLSLLRNKKAVFFQLVMPVFFVVLALVMIKTQKSTTDSSKTQPPPFNMTLEYYAKNSIVPHGKSLPGLLVFDSLKTKASAAVIADWKQTYQVDSYPPTTNTSDVRPHFVGTQLNDMTGSVLTNATILYNHTALHSVPSAVSMVTQSILTSSNVSATIRTSSLPWPTDEDEDGPKVEYDPRIQFAGMIIGLAFVLIIPGFSAEIVRDRESKVRGQLRISGASFNVYWGSIYTMNFIVYVIPTSLIIIVSLAMQIPGLSSAGAVSMLALLFILCIPFLCVFAMIVSFLFDKADTCSSYLPAMLYLTSIIPYMVVSFTDMLSSRDVSIILHYALCIVDPPYVIMGGFYFIARIPLIVAADGRTLKVSDYFDVNNHTFIAVAMPVIHVLWMYWFLRVLDALKTGATIRESLGFCCSKSTTTRPNRDVIHDEDNDVRTERSRIDAMEQHVTEEPVAYAKNIRKTFEKRGPKVGPCGCCAGCSGSDKYKKVAVRNLSFGVDEGEILGLLGPNGAGKTTSLNMVIAESEPTCGQVIVRGVDIRSNLLNASCLGYCPQHDALWENITLQEHIVCFARVKGVRLEETENLVDFYVSNMHLEAHKDKRSKNLSGGTKRKLSYIMSILGNPDLVLLDEPSTGMDPMSKRFLWDTISATFRNTNKGAILTTHYMEEADALCTRVGIMVNGQLQCIGSTQHLKNKFGSGYILEVKLSIGHSYRIELAMDQLENHLRELFPQMQRVERFMERAQYAIPRENVRSLGLSFAALEECKESHHLEEYSFSQSSLEQVFLHFAKKQKDEEAEEDSPDGHRPASHSNPTFNHAV